MERYCCSFYGFTHPFSSFSLFSNSSIGDPVLSPVVGCEHPSLCLPCSGRASQETAVSACSSWYPQHCLGLVTVYGMDPRVEKPLDGLSFSLCSILCLHIFSSEYFVPPSTNQSTQSSQGLNHQPKSTHGGTHGSSYICSRGLPCLTSVGGEAPGPVKA